jgi:hypothetical protein
MATQLLHHLLEHEIMSIINETIIVSERDPQVKERIERVLLLLAQNEGNDVVDDNM